MYDKITMRKWQFRNIGQNNVCKHICKSNLEIKIGVKEIKIGVKETKIGVKEIKIGVKETKIAVKEIQNKLKMRIM